MLAIADALAALLAVSALGYGLGDDVSASFWAALFLPVWIVLAKFHGLYDRDHRTLRHLTADELPTLCLWALTGTVATSVLLVAVTPSGLSMSAAVQTSALAASSVILLRVSARWLWRKLTPPEATIVIGSGPLANAIHRKLELFEDVHARIIGAPARLSLDSTKEAVHQLPQVGRIILASQTLDDGTVSALVALCRREKIKLTVVPPARSGWGTSARLGHIAELPVLDYNTWDVSRSTLLLKRAVDIVASAALLFLASPLFPAIAVAIRLETPGNPFFSQWRAGAGARPFRMHKFRTMVADAEGLLATLVDFDQLEQPMFKLARDPRMTRVGRLLRRTSLDELPQLWNVLMGEMSLVGPRPEQVELVERYSPEHLFRLSVKPGVTGPMQVFGRGQLTFEERLAVEREYVENLALGRDLRILALTIPAVASGKGAS